MDSEGRCRPQQQRYYENGGFQMQENGGTFKTPDSSISDKRRRRKSIVQITKEVLPRIENYRNSRRAVGRPSLGELHGNDDHNKEKNIDNVDARDQASSAHAGIKLGWIQGVLIPCLLNIFGVMLFLRLSWIVSEAGTGLSLIIILISAIVCVITTLSLSAICTNGEVKGGGIYYIISRSLGPEFGASVGIVFAFANAVSASMNTIGFCNSLSALLRIYGYSMFGSDINDARVIGTAATLVMIAICAIGMEWESKAQNFLIAIIVAAMVDFIVGTIIGPTTDLQLAQGFTGFNATVWQQNWYPEYRAWNNQKYDFFQVFAIFFPSVTGIQAGANISGDLKDPASAIPKGTLLSLVITMTSYALFMLFAGGAAMRDASGNVTDLHAGNLTDCISFDDGCKFGIFSSDQMMTIMSAWWPLIYAGCWAACLSTALTNLLSVPRLIQALGIDQIYPGLIFFSKGYGKNGEPYRGYILTFLVAEAFLLIGELNDIAKLISNFYLASYALINFCTFHAALVKPLGWRPTFKYYNTWLSLFGFIACVVIMFLINWITSLVTFIVILGLYLVVVYRNPDVNWGSSTQAQTYKTALLTAQKLINVGEHVKNYKPQVLVLCGQPKHRPSLMDFANLVTKNHSLLIVGDIIEENMNHKQRSQRTADGYAFLKSNKIKAFYAAVDHMDFETGATGLMQMSGIGKLTPNVLMMGYKNEWTGCSDEQLLAYFNILHAAFDHHLAVAILRVKGGLDYGSLTDIDDSQSERSVAPSNRLGSLRTSPSSNLMMHSDSNLSLEVAVTKESGENVTVKDDDNIVKIDGAVKGDSVMTALSEKEKKKKAASVKLEVVLGMSNEELLHVEDMNIFRKKQGKGFIDVYWLYDDGGLTMLLPYIISTRRDWSNCKLRVYGLASNKNDLALEERNMAHLLTKFRLNYAALKVVSVSDRPKPETIALFDSVVEQFRSKNHALSECQITDTELNHYQEKTHRQLRLRELLLENSSDANLIVMSLPMPRKGSISAPLYMSWLEILSRDMPPFLLIRGNQQSVLTYYS